MKTTRVFLPILLILSMQHPGLAQENAAFQQPASDFKLADEMFRHKNMGQARQLYHEISTDKTHADADIQAGAMLREAITAAELTNLDAPALLMDFAEEYPENAQAGEVNLYLGKIYFRDNKFKDAVSALQKVKVSNLNKSGREEYYFMMGYSQLKTGDVNSAKAYLQRISDAKSPYYSQSKYFLAHIDYTQGNYTQALKAFEDLEYDKRYEKVIPVYKIQIYHYLGDYEKIMTLGPALLESPNLTNKAEIARITGNAYFNTGDFANAAIYLNIFEKANRKPLSREDHYLLGYVSYKAGEYKNAIDNFQKATKQDDALSQNASYYLGVCYNETGQPKYAGTAFLAAYKNGIDKELAEEALFAYIKINLESPGNPYNESISLLESYLKANPGSGRADEGYGYLSALYLSSRNYKQALTSIETIGSKNAKMQEAYQKILFYRAAELFNMEDLEGSKELYTKSSEMTSDEMVRVESLYWIGEIFYLQQNYWAAIKYYKDFLGSKQAKKSTLYPNASYSLGYTYFNKKEYADAITYFNKFLETGYVTDKKLVSDAYLRLGDAYFISKQYDKAITNYDKVITANESSMDYALYHKALSEGARGDFNRKIDVLKVLISTYPRSTYNDDAYYETALAYILLNQENQALTYFDKLAQLYPTSSKAIQANLRKGFIYFNRNEFSQAIQSFKTVTEKYPGTQEAQEALAALKNIYIETGEVDQYYAYAKSLSFAEVNASEEDSLNYEVANNYYLQGKCQQALGSFQKYLDSFPNGAFVSDALYFQAECRLKSNELPQALEGFKKVAEKPRSRFTEPALATAASLEYSAKNYAAALPLFEQLETVAEDPDNVIASLTGQMRCHFLTGNFAAAALAAQKIQSTGKVSSSLADEIHFTLAKCYLAQSDLTLAESEFIHTAKLAGTENGAEASYYLAEIAFQTNRTGEAEERVYSLSEKFAAYDYWVAKGFILLADIFVKNGNNFQARETLESVIENYKGPELGEIAKAKLNALGNE